MNEDELKLLENIGKNLGAGPISNCENLQAYLECISIQVGCIRSLVQQLKNMMEKRNVGI